MLRNMLIAVAVAAIVAPAVVTTEAIAGSSTGRKQDAHSAEYFMSLHRRHAAHRSTHGFGVGRTAYFGYAVLPRASAFRGPGYIYVPRIVDDACNLPTSACPNEFRNVN